MAEGSHRHSHHHHHRLCGVSNGPTRWSWRRDKKMIIGLIVMAVGCVILAVGPGRSYVKEIYMLVYEWLQPEPENPGPDVDPLKTNYQLKNEREQTGDSVAAALNIDSMRREIRKETVPVYRPPRKKDKWYLSEEDVKDLRRGAKNNEE